MKPLAILGVLLCLVLMTGVAAAKRSGYTPSTKIWKPIKLKLPQCRPDYKLEAIKEELKMKYSNLTWHKRSYTPPFQCIHVGIIQDEQGSWVFHQELYKCCLDCIEQYYICALGGGVNFVCSSQAHTCSCGCRDLWQPIQKRRKVIKKKVTRKYGVCKQKVCPRKRCCLKSLCIPLFSFCKKPKNG